MNNTPKGLRERLEGLQKDARIVRNVLTLAEPTGALAPHGIERAKTALDRLDAFVCEQSERLVLDRPDSDGIAGALLREQRIREGESNAEPAPSETPAWRRTASLAAEIVKAMQDCGEIRDREGAELAVAGLLAPALDLLDRYVEAAFRSTPPGHAFDPMSPRLASTPSEPGFGKFIRWLGCCSGPEYEGGVRLHFEGCSKEAG